MSIRGVLLDIDGTLLDSNGAHAAAYADALRSEGFEVPFERVLPLIGMGSEKLLPAIGLEPGSRGAERVQRRKKELFRERYLPTLRPQPGARDLVASLRKRGFTLTVATSAGNDELHALLRAARIDDLIDGVSTSSDANASKPDPDIIVAAASRSKLPANQLAMLGDTPYDITAAGIAGVPVIALRCGGWSEPDLAGASEIYENPDDLLRHIARSMLLR